MSSVNKVILVGNLGKDPELRQTQSQMAVCNLTVATAEMTGKDANRKEVTEWHNVVVWGKTAENCAKYLTKGSKIYAEGRLQTREYVAKDGSKRYATDVVANEIKFLSTKNSAERKEQYQSNTPNHDFPPADDVGFADLPF